MATDSNNNSSKRIAIIGAGATGMTATKACLEQGLTPVVFERTNYTGGLWRYQSTLDEDGTASVMRSTIINSSKEMSAFSDFSPPAHFPNYMHNTKMVAYFDMYAESFNFLSYVNFRTEIIVVEPAPDHAETGRWRIQSKNLDTKEEKTEIFDGVMVCTGHHGTVNRPTLPGEQEFRGKIMHTHSLKTPNGFEDKNVVVVGVGNSGGDAAVELSSVAKQVYLSTRTGTWVHRRVGRNGLPGDQAFHRRIIWFIMRLLPYSWICSLRERELNRNFDHEQYRLKPAHRVMAQHIMVNDALPNRILSGTVTVKPDIERLTANGVIFRGETAETPADVIILATGYRICFPFIPQSVLPASGKNDNRIRLFKHQFIPHLAHAHTLAFIGLIQPIGAILPISEMQSRWFALLNAGKLQLDSAQAMERDIERKWREVSRRYYQSARHTIQVDWLPFMEELADLIGVRPSIFRYLFTDPKLAFALLFGPAAPYQYRLRGPNAWAGAREATLTVMDRIWAPLHSSPLISGAGEQKKKLV